MYGLREASRKHVFQLQQKLLKASELFLTNFLNQHHAISIFNSCLLRNSMTPARLLVSLADADRQHVWSRVPSISAKFLYRNVSYQQLSRNWTHKGIKLWQSRLLSRFLSKFWAISLQPSVELIFIEHRSLLLSIVRQEQTACGTDGKTRRRQRKSGIEWKSLIGGSVAVQLCSRADQNKIPVDNHKISGIHLKIRRVVDYQKVKRNRRCQTKPFFVCRQSSSDLLSRAGDYLKIGLPLKKLEIGGWRWTRGECTNH